MTAFPSLELSSAAPPYYQIREYVQEFCECEYKLTPQYHMTQLAKEMGASHKLDLTSDVTHLIVGNIDTPKYKFTAKERSDVKVFDPDWLHAVREVWLEGGEVDLVELEAKHKLPTFYGLKICVTGFNDGEN